MASSDIPPKVCVLDIETYKTNFKDIKRCKIAIAGIKIYHRKGKNYRTVKYKCFFENELEQLKIFLEKFDGPIIGYNLYNFDNVVLSSYFSIRKIIPKTIDLLFLLSFVVRRVRVPSFIGPQPGNYKGLSLDNISWVNFNAGKTISGKTIPEMWKVGKKKEVIRYNENDCDLTFKLWLKFLQKKKVFFKDRQYADDEKNRNKLSWKKRHLFRPTRIVIVFNEQKDKMDFRSYSGKAKIPIVLKNNFYRYVLGQYPMSFYEFNNLTDSAFRQFFMKEEIQKHN